MQMKKNVAASVKDLTHKYNKTEVVRGAKPMTAKKPTAPQTQPVFKEDPVFAQAVQNYEAALKAIQEHKFEKAKPLLEKLLANGPKELADRARVHLQGCNQQLAN